MQQHIQYYIDAYSNFILNHLLLAENTTGINIVQLGTPPAIQTLSTSADSIPCTDLDYLFTDYTPIKLGDIVMDPSYEISLYFLCKESKFNIISVDTFYDSYYQLTGDDLLIMTFYSHGQPITHSKLQASSLITSSLNLGLQQDYEIYKKALQLIRSLVIRFYSPHFTMLTTDIEPTTTKACPAPHIPSLPIKEYDPSSLLTAEEHQALCEGLPPPSKNNAMSFWKKFKGMHFKRN